MDDVWAESADGWDDEPATRAYARAAFDSLLSVLAGSEIELRGARVVDFGCGTGLLTEYLVDGGAEVTAVDASPAMLAVLRNKAEQRGWTAVTTSTGLDDLAAGNDAVVCSSVCSLLDDYPATAARLASLLGPGGLFVQWDWEKAGDDADDHGLTRDEIAEALHGAALEQVEVTTAFDVEVDGVTMRALVGHGRRPEK